MTIKIRKQDKDTRIITFFFFWIMIIYPFINAASYSSSIKSISRLVVFVGLVFLSSLIKNIEKDQVGILFILSDLYMFFSGIFNFLIRGYSFESFSRECLYAICPTLLYFVFLYYPKKKQFYKLYTFLLVLLILLGLPLFFKSIRVLFFKQQYNYIAASLVSPGFGSYIGVIGFGFLLQLGFAYFLFKNNKTSIDYMLMFVFFVFAILTFQRSPVIGMVIAVGIYLLTRKKIKEFFILTLIIAIIAFILKIMSSGNLDNISLLKISTFLKSMSKQINTSLVLNERSDQMQIFNNSLFEFIFGAGVGTYSPNNPECIKNLSDAGYYRIFNEQGIVGFVLFFIPIIKCAIRFVKKKNFFGIYFVIFSMISFFFNRTIWSIPSVFVFYSILGLENGQDKDL